jgi:hypothetical protein
MSERLKITEMAKSKYRFSARQILKIQEISRKLLADLSL